MHESLPDVSSSSVLQSRLITILVGPQESKFIVHQDVLTKYHYFRGCLAGGFPEGTSKEIQMSEDDPTTFARVLEFIYFGTIPNQPNEEPLDQINQNEETLDRIHYPPNNDPDVETNSFVHTVRIPTPLGTNNGLFLFFFHMTDIVSSPNQSGTLDLIAAHPPNHKTRQSLEHSQSHTKELQQAQQRAQAPDEYKSCRHTQFYRYSQQCKLAHSSKKGHQKAETFDTWLKVMYNDAYHRISGPYTAANSEELLEGIRQFTESGTLEGSGTTPVTGIKTLKAIPVGWSNGIIDIKPSSIFNRP